ncbi:bifunctional phosphoribosylaminoimidazolecarboxamide formyltransferase/IMP cyclohydrolase PurH [bacterium CPR1]|nr:bifunctional phosphoribosylaminoimidazolecarboxamide formyltransferase/IMP cyclohydrolase PurH [bacterium CPR1]
MKRALLSVSDKTGLTTFAAGLAELGYSLLATGGTASLLREHGLPVEEVSHYTGSPEILQGRVKTLHPAIHGGLLARDSSDDRRELTSCGWDYLDLVVVNLYPFEATVARPGVKLEEAVEQIDIGGVAMIRAAAKNHSRVVLVCDPADYERVLGALRGNGLSSEERRALAVKGFQMTARYDRAISSYFEPAVESLDLFPVQDLRYGENPHQAARLLSWRPGGRPLGGELLSGKELSYNNLLDLDAAWRAVEGFSEPCACLIKHLSPCGMATAVTLGEAVRLARACDPVSAFGGILAVNRPLDVEAVAELQELFLEAIAAPAFPVALEKRKNCRLLAMGAVEDPPGDYRSVRGGLLWQERDPGDPAETVWQTVSQRPPSSQEQVDLAFAWRVCEHVKSNAIVLVKGQATVGIGGGQPNRVDCVRIAVQRAGERSVGSVLASDAFFPFPDSVEVAAAAGVTAVIHPGGSVRDAEVLETCDRLGLAVVLTGVRHFRH